MRYREPAVGSLPADDGGLTFVDVSLEGVSADWTTRVQRTDCDENIKDNGDDTVTMTWSYGK